MSLFIYDPIDNPDTGYCREYSGVSKAVTPSTFYICSGLNVTQICCHTRRVSDIVEGQAAH